VAPALTVSTHDLVARGRRGYHPLMRLDSRIISRLVRSTCSIPPTHELPTRCFMGFRFVLIEQISLALKMLVAPLRMQHLGSPMRSFGVAGVGILLHLSLLCGCTHPVVYHDLRNPAGVGGYAILACTENDIDVHSIDGVKVLTAWCSNSRQATGPSTHYRLQLAPGQHTITVSYSNPRYQASRPVTVSFEVAPQRSYLVCSGSDVSFFNTPDVAGWQPVVIDQTDGESCP
jgi:hypothetical protein